MSLYDVVGFSTRRSLVLAALWLAGCRDLSFPASGSGPRTPPSVSFLAPAPGQTVPLSPFVQVNADSPLGIDRVELSCPGAPALYSWSSPPYQGLVDVGPCRAQSTDAGSLFAIVLTARAFDKDNPQGSSSTGGLSLLVDGQAPVISIAVPNRVAPLQPLRVTVTSTVPLRGPPLVGIGTLQANVIPLGLSNRIFFGDVTATPGLGIDLYSGAPDADVPLSVLEDIEEPLPITVDAVGSNGNATHYTQTIKLSRIGWETSIPGAVLAVDAGQASARAAPSPGGVQLALSSLGCPWLPGFFAAADGTFTPFDVSALDGGFCPRAFDAQGRTWVGRGFSDGGTDHLLLNPGSIQVVREAVNALRSSTPDVPLVQVGDRVCEENLVPALQADGGTLCNGTTQHWIQCVGPSFDFTGPVASLTTSVSSPSQIGTSSGSTYWGVDMVIGAGCSSLLPNLTATLDGGAAQINVGGSPQRLLPAGDGGVVLSYGGAPYVVDSNFVSWGYYLCATRQCGMPANQILVARPDSTLITATPDNGFTRFEAWPVGVYSPSATGRIPVTYIYAGAATRLPPEYNSLGQSPLPINALIGPSGQLAVLMKSGNILGTLIVALLDPSLQPRWIYPYPHLVFISREDPQLVATADFSTLYLVDPTNNVLVALHP